MFIVQYFIFHLPKHGQEFKEIFDDTFILLYLNCWDYEKLCRFF